MTKEQRVNTIKSKLAKDGIKMVDVARELGITDTAVRFWIYGTMPSQKITDWFKVHFGEEFLLELKQIS